MLDLQTLVEIGVSRRRIAHQMNCSISDIDQLIRSNNFSISKRQWNPQDQVETDFIKLAHKNGVPIKTLASSIYNVSPAKVEKLFNELKLVQKDTASIHIYNISVFDNIDTQEKAYWLGYIFGDGANQEKSLNFSVAATKAKHLSKLATFIGDDGSRVILKDNYAKYKVYSKDLFDKLNASGLVSPKTNIRYPELSDELNVHFIRGYLDGKGSYSLSKKGEWKFAISGNLNMLNTIIKYSPVNLKLSKNSSGYDCIIISGNKKVLSFSEWIYEDADTYFSDRYQQYQLLKLQQNK